ncbi:hypothetical protein BDV95DRAFT_505392 [Massariosphaeria phaeospora]|uniref:Ion transport domain-containing protein n=1 Tax=Massariosphaeria phaeospora TaxID=100035 RepID=A0A7C8I7B3_9PLEO|nr:hypothetical protein BDV95DRAFT_505392 [Massariosphaeria phaeospora]
MFASLLRTRNDRRSETTPLLAALSRYRARRDDEEDHADEADDDDDPEEVAPYDGEDEDEDHHGRGDGPLLPVFSSEVLDRVPIYNTTHAIRLLVVQRCETTLSWDQLRSPQVSQFLVKPIQQQIIASHFSRGSLYCLLANCLQFRKEGELNPGNLGVSKSRALVCELLAMRLLKDFSTRELIDALSYDFDPLQGLVTPTSGAPTPGGANWSRQPRSMRISTLEIAIRASAKKFLAHPLVVQQLEAIWAGTIVFHSVADSLHRKSDVFQGRDYSTFDGNASPGLGPSRRLSPTKRRAPQPQPQPQPGALVRRTVTLYDPHDASLFKLSRLRVPRYRNFYSTLSYGVMLGLFLAVLTDKSVDITALEVLFWFWSAGYMLDEIVGFSEQGFGLYIMSFWNAFDLGILLMFLVYYVLRLYGILMPDVSRHYVASMAYDVLGSTAVLLFPRLFSSLDHYRYFSQLLIAFRMMAMDLVAILVLIVISCSGFIVAFTLAFKKDLGFESAAYAVFQMVMGFTPAAWEIWDDYNVLGKALLTLFLFICHFLIVTILVTVLTNSFMAVVQNANDEHQFLFAVNTISMVKSDALFSYIPPTNVIGWLCIPLKYTMPFKTFVRLNRLVIKLTHIPVLFTIFCYERLLLSNLAYGPTDLVEQRGRPQSKATMPAFSIRGPVDNVFSPGTRLREPSITTFHKDRALDEVFRRPFRNPSTQTPSHPQGRRNSGNVVTDWMQGMSTDGDAFPPQEDTRSVLDRLENRIRPQLRRTKTSGQTYQKRRHPLAMTRTAASDPDEVLRSIDRVIVEEGEPDFHTDIPQQTDADGDDELVTNDDDEHKTDKTEETDKRVKGAIKQASNKENRPRPDADDETSEDEFFRTPMTMKPRTPARTSTRVSSASSLEAPKPHVMSPSKTQTRQKYSHNRNLSTNTILFSPSKEALDDIARTPSPERRPRTSVRSGAATPARIAAIPDGRRTPKRTTTTGPQPTRPRPIMPPLHLSRQGVNFGNFISLDQRRRDPSFSARALDLASDLGDNKHAPDFGNLAGIPASFTTQFEIAARTRRKNNSDDESNRMSRIMLARMTTLEEGFRDVLKEVKGLRKGSEDGGPSRAPSRGGYTPPNEQAKKKGKGKKKSVKVMGPEPRMGSSV